MGDVVWRCRVKKPPREVVMHFRTFGVVLLTAVAVAAPALAQTTAPAITRTVAAATKLPTVVAVPLHFRAVSVTIQPGAATSFAGADGILYQMSGSTEVSIDGAVKTMAVGEGLFVASGKQVSLKAGSGEPSTLLHFLLVPTTDLNQPTETAPAVVKEIYRTAAPIPDLKPGSYDLNVTRVTFPARMPSNAPHHRSGAALYYIVSGTGANTVEGKTEQRGPGSLIYEPFGLVHQWGNPGDEPLTFLAFNINPDGAPAVVAEAPATPK
jgi:quercetin dioxygenase-like cupin family protein